MKKRLIQCVPFLAGYFVGMFNGAYGVTNWKQFTFWICVVFAASMVAEFARTAKGAQ